MPSEWFQFAFMVLTLSFTLFTEEPVDISRNLGSNLGQEALREKRTFVPFPHSKGIGRVIGLLTSVPYILLAQRWDPPCRSAWPNTEFGIRWQRSLPVPPLLRLSPPRIALSPCPKSPQCWQPVHIPLADLRCHLQIVWGSHWAGINLVLLVMACHWHCRWLTAPFVTKVLN